MTFLLGLILGITGWVLVLSLSDIEAFSLEGIGLFLGVMLINFGVDLAMSGLP